jgi:dTDP-4-amino-4,6-dideoxygalactose transaminase
MINNDSLAARIKRLRNGGQTDRYHHEELGCARGSTNCSRGTFCTAGAVEELDGSATRAGGPVPGDRRRHVDLPHECDTGHVYHLFVVRSRDRRRLQASLAAQGIETLVHYPIPIPRQAAFAAFASAACPIAARVCDEIVSLPLHPRMTDDDVATVAQAVVKGQ